MNRFWFIRAGKYWCLRLPRLAIICKPIPATTDQESYSEHYRMDKRFDFAGRRFVLRTYGRAVYLT